MRSKMKKMKNIIALSLSVIMLGSSVSIAEANDYDEYFNNDFSFTNDNMKTVSEEEAKKAELERQTGEDKLGYTLGAIIVGYSKAKLVDTMKEKNLDNPYDIIKEDIIEKGDKSAGVLYNTSTDFMITIILNPNKSVETAVSEYSQLNCVKYAQPDYIHDTDPIPDPAPDPEPTPEPLPTYKPVKATGIYSICNDDSISLGCVHEGGYEKTKYRWVCCDMDNPSTGWQEISDWNSSNWALWRPDANETYAVVCMVSCNGDEKVDSQVVWYVSRPQMGKRILGNCATPTNDGLLYGCTSNVTSQDSDYWTSCYIYSFELQGWIAIGSSNAYGASWFKVSSLPSGTYMMYTCTEKTENAQRRKLSCNYYLFTI